MSDVPSGKRGPLDGGTIIAAREVALGHGGRGSTRIAAELPDISVHVMGCGQVSEALLMAAQGKQWNIVQEFFADPNIQDAFGRTLLL